MANLDEIYPSKWIRAEHLEAPELVTIAEVGQTEFKQDDGSTKRQVTLGFEERQGSLGLNLTNANMVAGICKSRNIDEWVGHKIVIYATQVQFGSKMVDAVRIRPPRVASGTQVRKQVPAIPYDDPDDPGADDSDIPFNHEAA